MIQYVRERLQICQFAYTFNKTLSCQPVKFYSSIWAGVLEFIHNILQDRRAELQIEPQNKKQPREKEDSDCVALTFRCQRMDHRLIQRGVYPQIPTKTKTLVMLVTMFKCLVSHPIYHMEVTGNRLTMDGPLFPCCSFFLLHSEACLGRGGVEGGPWGENKEALEEGR